jgi:outer membrane protein
MRSEARTAQGLRGVVAAAFLIGLPVAATGQSLTIPFAGGSQVRPGPMQNTTVAARALTLEQALELALRNGQEVQLARAQVDLAETQITAARAEALPEITGSAGYTRTFASPFDTGGDAFTIPDDLRFDPDPTQPLDERVRYLEDNAPNAALQGLSTLFSDLPFGQQNAYTASVSVSQLLYSGGQVGAALNIAEHVRATARLNLAEDAAEVRRQVRTAYYQALLAQELAAIAEEGLAQADRVYAYEQLRLQAGQAAELAVLQAEVARDNLRPQLVQARNALELAVLNLKRLIDIPLREPIVLTTALDAPRDLTVPEERLSPGALIGQRAALEAAQRQVRIRDEQVNVVRGSYLPRVSATMSYGRQLFPEGIVDFTGDWRTDWTAGVTVRVPIFTGFRRGADIARAQLEQRQAELQLQQLTKSVQLEYEQALGEKERARVAIVARQRTAEVAERVYDLTVLVFEQGLTTQLQVSDSRLQLLQARSNLAQAIADYHIADAGTERAQTTPSLAGIETPAPIGNGTLPPTASRSAMPGGTPQPGRFLSVTGAGGGR